MEFLEYSEWSRNNQENLWFSKFCWLAHAKFLKELLNLKIEYIYFKCKIYHPFHSAYNDCLQCHPKKIF